VIVKKPIQIDIMDEKKQRTYGSHHVKLIAEAFEVNYDFQYPKGLDHLLFGTLKVGQAKPLVCSLKNRGKYTSFFKFAITNKVLAKSLRIVPMEGSVSPGERGVMITFTLQDMDNHRFSSGKGIEVTIVEGQQKLPVGTLAIPFTYETVYSAYTITPPDFLDFGPLPIGISRVNDLTIENTGVFPFDFEITPQLDGSEDSSSTRGGRSRRGPKSGSPTTPKHRRTGTGGLTLGQFCVSPVIGVVQPGAKQIVIVEYSSHVASTYESQVRIRIRESHPTVAAGFLYGFRGSSCIPGILTNDFEKIFPGQNLCLRYDITSHDGNAFLEDEQRFHFAPTITSESRTVTMALLNPFPVPCTVDLKLNPGRQSPHKKPQTAPRSKKPLAFALSQTPVEIPPNETREIDLTFAPLASTQYHAVLHAVVRGGTDLTTNSFTVGVDGRGAVPTIAFFDHPERTRSLAVSFGKGLLGLRKVKPIGIVNDGLLPARIVVHAKATPDFQIENFDRVHEFQLETGGQFNLRVAFIPTTAKKAHSEISISLVDNPKASLSVGVSGEGFSEDIYFDGLADEGADLIFKDNVVGQEQQLKIIAKNTSPFDVRFSFQSHPDFKFTPSCGHLHKHSTKPICVTFLSDKSVHYHQLKLSCTFQKIELYDPEPVEWDDSMITSTMVQRRCLNTWMIPQPPTERRTTSSARRSLRKSAVTSRRGTMRRKTLRKFETLEDSDSSDNPDEWVKVTEVKPEPDYRLVGERSKDIALLISAVCDHITYQLSATDVSFGPAMMFDTDSATIEMKNTSQIRFGFEWIASGFEALKTPYAITFPSPFSIKPYSGFIEHGQTTTFTISFCPLEVDDFKASFRCSIPSLTQMPEPVLNMTGFSRRPICHFTADVSDYLSARRRHPDYTYPLPDDVKVIELFANGVGKLMRRKFELINTTELPYEVFWEEDKAHGHSAIRCEIQRAFVSSGQHHVVSFCYRPTSVKCIEAVWTFTIPSQEVVVTFLIVGRVMRH
jgi:hydrocephalus-inducing protein